MELADLMGLVKNWESKTPCEMEVSWCSKPNTKQIGYFLNIENSKNSLVGPKIFYQDSDELLEEGISHSFSIKKLVSIRELDYVERS